jgi:hypothetical protein
MNYKRFCGVDCVCSAPVRARIDQRFINRGRVFP